MLDSLLLGMGMILEESAESAAPLRYVAFIKELC